MATYPEFNLAAGQKAERKMMITYVDVSGKHPDDADWETEAVWEAQGYGVEDSAVELNPDEETTTDILGITETNINALEESQSMEPFTVRGGSKLAEMLVDMVIRRATSELQRFTVMRAYYIYGTTGGHRAHYDKNCTISPQSIGGSGYLDIPSTFTFSGDRTHGTVAGEWNDPTFTKTTP